MIKYVPSIISGICGCFCIAVDALLASKGNFNGYFLAAGFGLVLMGVASAVELTKKL
jgi:hypothetical protein